MDVENISEKNDVRYRSYKKFKEAQIFVELPGNDWSSTRRENFEENIYKYFSGEISDKNIIESM